MKTAFSGAHANTNLPFCKSFMQINCASPNLPKRWTTRSSIHPSHILENSRVPCINAPRPQGSKLENVSQCWEDVLRIAFQNWGGIFFFFDLRTGQKAITASYFYYIPQALHLLKRSSKTKPLIASQWLANPWETRGEGCTKEGFFGELLAVARWKASHLRNRGHFSDRRRRARRLLNRFHSGLGTDWADLCHDLQGRGREGERQYPERIHRLYLEMHCSKGHPLL